jgi:GntR family transcriptional regulator
VRRLLLAGERAGGAGRHLAARAAVQGPDAERLSQAYRGPMYGLFEAEFGVRMIRAEEKIRAVAAGDEEAALLGVAPGAPLLLVERLSFTYGDRPVELRRGLYRHRSALLSQRAQLSTGPSPASCKPAALQ